MGRCRCCHIGALGCLECLGVKEGVRHASYRAMRLFDTDTRLLILLIHDIESREKLDGCLLLVNSGRSWCQNG